MRKVLKENPAVNVNWRNEKYGFTPLLRACYRGYDKIVSLLLAHPDIDVNSKGNGKDTPFYWACRNGHSSCVQFLLRDARVKLNEPDIGEHTPLRCAAVGGHLEVIKLWIASGREMELGEPGNWKTDVIGVAWMRKKIEVISLLKKFKAHPSQTRNAVRTELGIAGERIQHFPLSSFFSISFLFCSVIRFPCHHSTQADQGSSTLPSLTANHFLLALSSPPLPLQLLLSN